MEGKSPWGPKKEAQIQLGDPCSGYVPLWRLVDRSWRNGIVLEEKILETRIKRHVSDWKACDFLIVKHVVYSTFTHTRYSINMFMKKNTHTRWKESPWRRNCESKSKHYKKMGLEPQVTKRYWKKEITPGGGSSPFKKGPKHLEKNCKKLVKMWDVQDPYLVTRCRVEIGIFYCTIIIIIIIKFAGILLARRHLETVWEYYEEDSNGCTWERHGLRTSS